MAQSDGFDDVLKFWRLLDSDQPGERNNALDKIHAIFKATNPPRRFIDIYERLDKLAAERARAVAANKSLKQERDEYFNEVQGLIGRLAAFGVVEGRWTRIDSYQSWAKGMLFGVMLALLPLTGLNLLPVDSLMRHAVRSTGLGWKASARERAVKDLLRGVPWNEVQSMSLNAVNLNPGGASPAWNWIAIKARLDTQTRVDTQARYVNRYCLDIYTAAATKSPDNTYLPPPDFRKFDKDETCSVTEPKPDAAAVLQSP